MTADTGRDIEEIRERVTNERNDLAPPELAAYLRHDDASVRESATLAVGNIEIEDTDAVAQLVDPVVDLLDDPEHRVRAQAPVALANLAKSNPEAVRSTLTQIVTLLGDESIHVRTNTVYALSEIGREYPDELAVAVGGWIPELLDHVEDSVRQTREQAVEVLLVYATRTNCDNLLEHIETVIDMLQEGRDAESWQLEGTPQINRQQREMMERAQSEEATLATDIREGSLFILLEIADAHPDTVEPYLPTIHSLLDDESPAVRQRVVDIFGTVCQESATNLDEHASTLISVFLNEEYGPVARAKAASALGEAIETDPTVAETVLLHTSEIRNLLTATNERIQAASAGLWSYVAEFDSATAETATEELFALLQNDDPLVRGNAVSALGFIEREEVRVRLEEVRDDDPHEDVRSLAAEVLDASSGD